MKPTSKYVDVSVHYSCSMIGKFRCTMWIWKAKLQPVIVQWLIHPDITGQRAVGQFSPKDDHVTLPLHCCVGMTSHLKTVQEGKWKGRTYTELNYGYVSLYCVNKEKKQFYTQQYSIRTKTGSIFSQSDIFWVYVLWCCGLRSFFCLGIEADNTKEHRL